MYIIVRINVGNAAAQYFIDYIVPVFLCMGRAYLGSPAVVFGNAGLFLWAHYWKGAARGVRAVGTRGVDFFHCH